MFPFLLLPFLCIQKVTEYWNPIEIFNFSSISNRTKRVSKSVRKEPTRTKLFFHQRFVNVCYSDDQSHKWSFGGFDDPIDAPEFGQLARMGQYLYIESARELSSYFQLVDHILDVFNNSLKEITFYLTPPMTNQQLISIINWLNNHEKSISEVRIQSSTGSLFKLFMDTFRKPVREFAVFSKCLDSENTVITNSKFEIDQLFGSCDSKLFNLDFLMSIDCEDICVNNILSSEELNVFVRSWQEEKTNSRLKTMAFSLESQYDFRVGLSGCEAEFLDPRTTKVWIERLKYWIHGGIYIKRRDGRIAIIERFTHISDDENVEIPQEVVDKYLNEVKKWDSEDTSAEEASDNDNNDSYIILYITMV